MTRFGSQEPPLQATRPFRESLAELLADLIGGLAWDPKRGLRVEDGRRFPVKAALVGLRDLVYSRYFCRWAPPAPGSPGGGLSPHVSGDAEFVSRLGRATGGARFWDHGWRTVASGQGYAFLADDEIMLFVDEPDAVWPASPAPGAAASVLLPCARENLSPGFFYLIGTRGRFDRSKPYPRLYMNVAPEAAPDLVAALLAELSDRGVAFEAKLSNDPVAYCRVDPAVLYTSAESYREAAAVLLELASRTPRWWRDGTPLFALPLARGIAAAECPSEAAGPLESFGHHRCRLLALGVLAALKAGESGPAAVLARVASVFAGEGLSLEHPHTHHLAPEFWQMGTKSSM